MVSDLPADKPVSVSDWLYVTAAASVRPGDFIKGCSNRNPLSNDNSIILNVGGNPLGKVDVV